MAFNPAPTNLLGDGYAADSTTLTLALADFPEVTSTEAHPTTGDSRKVLFGILSSVQETFAALASADRPSKLRISKSSTAINASGGFTQTFTISFDLSASGIEVVAE